MVDPIFVFEGRPTLLMIYRSAEGARESLESLDVAEGQAAFTADGRVVDVRPTDGLFAQLVITKRRNLPRLRSLLKEVRGPAHLAEDPMAYAVEWLRIDEVAAEKPPWSAAGRLIRRIAGRLTESRRSTRSARRSA